MLKHLLMLYFLLLTHVFHAQVTVYQDVFRGEVTYVGTSSGDASGQISLPTNLPMGSTIKKIFLVWGAMKGFNYTPFEQVVEIDNTPINLTLANATYIQNGNNTFIPSNADYNGNLVLFKDLSNYISSVNNALTINWLLSTIPPFGCPGCRHSAPMLVILVENLSMPEIAVSIVLNNKDNDDSIFLTQNNLLPYTPTSPIALGIHSDRLGGGSDDGYSFVINGTNAGLIRSPDDYNYSLFYGAVGCFHYGNNVLTGLTDDNPDSVFSGPAVTSNFADGLVTLNSYLNGSINPLTMEVSYTGNSSGQHNNFIGFTLAYTTPCQPQNVSVSSDTTICPNEPLQLFATGGVNYEWLPATGLSCTTCANPVFVGDSSQLFTVRIWGNDSCSVVRPVMIHVRQQPTIAALVPTTTTCGLNQGTVQLTLADTAAVQFAIDNGPLQDTAYFSNLSAGSHTLSLHDAVGCSFDTLVTIAADTTVSALFTATPSTGAAPLQVALSNQSINATDYVWQLDGVTQANPFSSFTATASGTVQVQLIAYQNNPSCADTAWTSIFVYDSVIVSIPNVFSPNNDNTNEFFGITSNTPLTISGALVNRWGQTMVAWEDQVTSVGFTQLWNGTNAGTPASDGVYFYHITWSQAGKTGELTGNVSLVR
jgi:gliding motility-associated-like protein